MRYVVTALAIVALLAIWLITQYPDYAGPNEVLTAREVAPPTMPREPELPIANQEAFEATIPEKFSSATASVVYSIESNAPSNPTRKTPAIEFGPEQRVKIVEYLSRSGLAVADSERIADAALDRVKECIGEAFGGNDPTSTLIETCMFNVLAAYGLYGVAGAPTTTSLSITLPD